MILKKQHAGQPIRRIEFVWNIPTQGTKLSSLLHNGMQEGDGVHQRYVLPSIRVVQQVLVNFK